ncbi:hypothetical protein Taro_002759 [Colocasia esculenta]|uniref:Uncharacterized protein n=1 Tax=Colocasia esculenta TaxID=4460 RepID=A0A843TF39_COLES|nr:hypothetical protein [Colocasia esculenta]
MSRPCDTPRHQQRRRPGRARPYRGALGDRDKDRCRDLVSHRDRCSALEGLSHLEVVSVSWDPHPREPVEGVLRATSVLELAAHTSRCLEFLTQTRQSLSHCLSLRWFRSHVVVLGVRPQLGQAVVLRVLRVLGGSASPFVEAEARARQASRGLGRRIPLLAASGGSLVVVVVTAFPHDVSNSVPGCQSVVTSACVVSRPRGVSRVRSGSECGPSTLWRSEVAVLVGVT